MQFLNLFNEIMDRERDRNEMLKDSPYSAFALSDKELMKDIRSSFDKALKNNIDIMVRDNVKGTPIRKE
jgi:hypothetical protein|tara:strand:- start:89 stop:295 length:207 start_codon:yes stop_codon:yes gene_type:complete